MRGVVVQCIKVDDQRQKDVDVDLYIGDMELMDFDYKIEGYIFQVYCEKEDNSGRMFLDRYKNVW